MSLRLGCDNRLNGQPRVKSGNNPRCRRAPVLRWDPRVHRPDPGGIQAMGRRSVSPSDIETIDAIIRWVTSLASAFSFRSPCFSWSSFCCVRRSPESPPASLRALHLAQAIWRGGGTEQCGGIHQNCRSHILALPCRDSDKVLRPGHIAQRRRASQGTRGEASRSRDRRVVECIRPPAPRIQVVDIVAESSSSSAHLPAGGGDGRSWSIRYGIVGRTWRHMESYGEGNLKMSHADSIDQWGMTIEEASRRSQPGLP